MKIQVMGLDNIELNGRIARSYVSNGHLVLDVRLSRPVGWLASTQLTRADIFAFLWIALSRPSILCFILFGIGGRSSKSATHTEMPHT